MNWTKILLAGLTGGIAVWIYNFVMHGFILGATYTDHPAFSQEQANPLWFLLVGICIGIAGALLFAKSRRAWSAGVKGGAVFGFFIGLTAYFTPFYHPLVIDQFPYHLAWCWGAIDLVGWMIYGTIAALFIKVEVRLEEGSD